MCIWLGKEVAKFVEQPPEIKINPNGVDIGASEVWELQPNSVSTLHGKIRKTEPCAREKYCIIKDTMGDIHTEMVRLFDNVTLNEFVNKKSS